MLAILLPTSDQDEEAGLPTGRLLGLLSRPWATQQLKN
jgi:hypothetical protein